jgi:hypothetical protein
MPIPVGRSGNVDGEGGIPNRIVRIFAVAGSGRAIDIHVSPPLRIWDEPHGIQPFRAIRGARAALALGVAVQTAVLRSAALAPPFIMEELTDHADDHGADGS